MTFLSDVMAFEKKALLAASQKTSNVVEELLTQVVVRSPTKTGDPVAVYSKGLLINQWYSNVGTEFDTSITDAKNDSGIDSLSRIKSTLKSSPFLGRDNTITLTNNTEQAYRAEYLGWPVGPGTNGWVWTNNVQAYAMVRSSVVYVQGKYT